MSVNERLRAFLDSQTDTYKEISRRTGIPTRTLYNIVEPGASIKFEYLQKLAEYYGLNYNEIAKNGTSRVMEDYQAYHLDLDDEFTRIPYLRSIKAGAGFGMIEESAEKHDIAFRKYFIQNTLASSATELIALRIGGNSMEPILRDGDDILVDRSKIQVKEGPAYLIRIDEEIFVKYLTKLPGKRLKVWSENRAFEPFEVDLHSSAGEFEVLGQVVWWAHVSEYL